MQTLYIASLYKQTEGVEKFVFGSCKDLKLWLSYCCCNKKKYKFISHSCTYKHLTAYDLIYHERTIKSLCLRIIRKEIKLNEYKLYFLSASSQVFLFFVLFQDKG